MSGLQTPVTAEWVSTLADFTLLWATLEMLMPGASPPELSSFLRMRPGTSFKVFQEASSNGLC